MSLACTRTHTCTHGALRQSPARVTAAECGGATAPRLRAWSCVSRPVPSQAGRLALELCGRRAAHLASHLAGTPGQARPPPRLGQRPLRVSGLAACSQPRCVLGLSLNWPSRFLLTGDGVADCPSSGVPIAPSTDQDTQPFPCALCRGPRRPPPHGASLPQPRQEGSGQEHPQSFSAESSRRGAVTAADDFAASPDVP